MTEIKKLNIKSSNFTPRKYRFKESTKKELKKKEERKNRIIPVVSIILVFPVLVAALYLLLNEMTTKEAKVYVTMAADDKGRFVDADNEVINEKLRKGGQALLNIRVETEPEYWNDPDRVERPKDYIYAKVMSTEGKKLGEVKFQLDIENDKIWSGSGNMMLNTTETPAKLDPRVHIIQTNRTRTADKISRAYPIE